MSTSSTRSAEIAASCFTGAAVIAITNPLDCLKQRWQVEPGARSLSTFSQEIVQREGLVQGLWKPGIASNMCACTISVGTRLGLYPVLRDAVTPAGQARSGFGMFVSGLLGGALGYVAAAPFFMVSRIAQAEAGIVGADGLYATGAKKGKMPTAGSHASSSGLPLLAHLASEQGIKPLWRGAEVLVARGAIMSATQLATYDKTKGLLKRAGLEDGPLVHCVASLAASLVLTTAICPFDYTYTAYLAGPHLGRSYANPLACARELVTQGGLGAMFRGWTPLWLRFLPSSVLTFVIYEQSRKLLLGNYLD